MKITLKINVVMASDNRMLLLFCIDSHASEHIAPVYHNLVKVCLDPSKKLSETWQEWILW